MATLHRWWGGVDPLRKGSNVDIVEFFQSETVSLPKDRSQGDFEAFVDQIFMNYLRVIGELDGNDPISQELKLEQPAVEKLCTKIRDAVGAYLVGFPHKAFHHLTQGIQAVRHRLDELASNPTISDDMQRLYRIRLGTLEVFGRKDLFHLPFELRHKVQTQRYSIPGLPSLYLGGSLWVCWEELGRPDFHTMQLTRFRAVGPVKVIDLGYRPLLNAVMIRQGGAECLADTGVVNMIISQAVCWPLIAACSIKVLNSNSPFVPEYVVPQLVLQWLRSESDCDGLRYFTTKITPPIDAIFEMMNYVFPVQRKASTGYCSILRGKFELSAPIPWPMLQQASSLGHFTHVGTWRMPLVEGVSVGYQTTDFGRSEARLEDFPTEQI